MWQNHAYMIKYYCAGRGCASQLIFNPISGSFYLAHNLFAAIYLSRVNFYLGGINLIPMWQNHDKVIKYYCVARACGANWNKGIDI